MILKIDARWETDAGQFSVHFAPERKPDLVGFGTFHRTGNVLCSENVFLVWLFFCCVPSLHLLRWFALRWLGISILSISIFFSPFPGVFWYYSSGRTPPCRRQGQNIFFQRGSARILGLLGLGVREAKRVLRAGFLRFGQRGPGGGRLFSWTTQITLHPQSFVCPNNFVGGKADKGVSK